MTTNNKRFTRTYPAIISGINADSWGEVKIDLLNMSTTGLTTIAAGDTIEVAFAFYSDGNNYSDDSCLHHHYWLLHHTL